ncbi:MAG: sigma-54 dependent transcriptional regulator, partial [Candidatus Marinimicrobia bacterium]|nr:sigma-54 dependent transcriptional regulator [Candidatus Neomarinimicrobiota bacterium]
IVITDIYMPRMNGFDLMKAVHEKNPSIFFIIFTAYASLETAIDALRLGAFDYLIKPFTFESLILKINKLIEHKELIRENAWLRKEIHHHYDFHNIVGQSPAMMRLFAMIRRISGSDSNVFIVGKRGTGKELIARTIHYHSLRRNNPFISVNCNAIPDDRLDHELFGYYEKGNEIYPGLFQNANEGTLYLDEITDLSDRGQLKILRAVEHKEIFPVGINAPLRINVRIIAATNRDPLKEIQEGRFREDVYYRLNVIHIPIPELSERKEDIPLLVEFFIQKFNKSMGKNIKGMTPDALDILKNHRWRGEVRELENIVEQAMIFSKKEYLDGDVLPNYLTQTGKLTDENISDGLSLAEATKKFQYIYIMKTLKKFKGHRGKTAKQLKISEPTLYRKLQEKTVDKDKRS